MACISLKEMFAEAISNEDEVSGENSIFQANDLSEILFTTGTTGKSKGIEIIYKNNVAIAQNVSEAIGITADDTELVTAPLNHSMALRRTYSVFYKGGSVVLTDGVKFIEDFFKLMDMYKVTAITFAPAILEQLLKFAKERFGKYNKLHYIQLDQHLFQKHVKNFKGNVS
ncbi:MAG: AMP-binding protein [Eubacterium sp.]